MGLTDRRRFSCHLWLEKRLILKEKTNRHLKAFWDQFEEHCDCTRKELPDMVDSFITKNKCAEWAGVTLKPNGRFDKIYIQTDHVIKTCFKPEIDKCVKHLGNDLKYLFSI